MPELPEVEAARRLMSGVLTGHRLANVDVLLDDIVFCQTPSEAISKALQGRLVTGVGRKGKYWWLELDELPWLVGHLGMTGAVTDLTPGAAAPQGYHRRGVEKSSPLREVTDQPRFLKLLLQTDQGGRIAITDGRRLARMWLSENLTDDPRLAKLGPDALDGLPEPADLHALLSKRKAPMKAVLLDQSVFAGVGNYLADEVLYQSRISPSRLGTSLSFEDTCRLHDALTAILRTAVGVDADYERFPEDWLFHHRWGGTRGSEKIQGHDILRETIGGRTTAWVPDLQR